MFYAHKQTKDKLDIICKECKKARSAKWAKDNPEKNMAKTIAYNNRHPDRRKKTLSKYYENNKETIRNRVKESMVKNPDLYAELGRTHSNRRRARKLENGFEPYTEQQIIEAYGLLCNICQKSINFIAPRKVGVIGWERGLHIDHVIPISKGGSDTLDNVRPTHGLCNLRKSNLLN